MQKFESFINSQLCVVYQLLESRILIDFDSNILTIMYNLAKNSQTCPDPLVRAVADLACFFRQMYTQGSLVCRIVSCLLAKRHVQYEQEPEVSWMPVQLIDLAEKMVLAAKCESAGASVSFEQECLGSAFIVGQIIIQVASAEQTFKDIATAGGKFYADTFLEYMLELVENLHLTPDSYLYSRLYGVFLSAFVFAPAAGIQFLVRQGRFEEVLKNLSYKINSFVTVYDKKLLVLGMISIFREKVRQQQLDGLAIDALDLAIKALHVQRIEEELKFVGGAVSEKSKKQQHGFKTQLSQTEREDQNAYNLIKGRNYDLSLILEDPSPGDAPGADSEDILAFMLSDTREADRSIADIASPVNQIDEFSVFKQLMIELKVAPPDSGPRRPKHRQPRRREALQRLQTRPARTDDRRQDLDHCREIGRRRTNG